MTKPARSRLALRGLTCILLLLLLSTLPVEARQVKLGIDVLAANNFDLLQGKRVGLVTNQTGVNGQGTKTRLVMHRHPQVNLVALYTPEHGLDGKEKAGKYVRTRRDSLTDTIAYSLYGETRKPTPAMLEPIDIMVYDMQDIGSRSYTYISTMIKCMEACADAGKTFVVLDRPNPVGGIHMEGPMIEKKWISFVGQVPVPYRHGMTAGEIAYMANNEGWLETRNKVRLQVVKMQGWHRGMAWSDTGLRWVRTSPNVPHAFSPFHYLSTGIAGSVKRTFMIGLGTDQPFGYLDSPHFDAGFINYIRAKVPGVNFTPFDGYGIRINIDEHSNANLTSINFYAISYANRRANQNLITRSARYDKHDILYKVLGSKDLAMDLGRNADVDKLVADWQRDVGRFARERLPYLLYQ